MECIFNDTLVKDQGMLSFYSDIIVSSIEGKQFKANLFHIIEMSKTVV